MAIDRSEIAFFDLETTRRPAEQKWTILEFGVILICPQKLVEVDRFSALIRPADIYVIPETGIQSNGITRDAVANERKFEEVADTIYEFLNGRVWAGHNIVSCDSVCIREAFDEIGRSPPEAKELIDSYPLLEDKFGRHRAGDMKMATLATYFGLGSQKHRSIEDVKMNIEVLKSCATVLFLESNFPNVLGAAILSELPGASTLARQSSKKLKASTEIVSGEKYEHFLEPHEISLRITSQWGTRTHKMTLLHKDIPLRMRSINMKIRFNGMKYFQPTGKPQLSFVVEPSLDTCDILKDCETVAQNLFLGWNDRSEWKHVVTTKYGPNPVIRIHIETAGSEETSTYSTYLYRRNSEGTTQRPASKTMDLNELDELFVKGRFVDAEYNFDIYRLLK